MSKIAEPSEIYAVVGTITSAPEAVYYDLTAEPGCGYAKLTLSYDRRPDGVLPAWRTGDRVKVSLSLL